MAQCCTRSSLPNYFVMTSYHWNTEEIRQYSLFRGYSFNISGNFKVHVSLKKHCRPILQLHWKWSNSNMILVGERQQITWCLAQNVVYLRVVSKFVNFNSTLVICLKFVFIEMLDKLFTYKTMYQVLPVAWTNRITNHRYHDS